MMVNDRARAGPILTAQDLREYFGVNIKTI
jgi:hypothetical protein